MHVVYLALRLSASTGVIGNTCGAPDLKQDFDINLYTGLWYEFARSESIPFEDGDCVTAQYSLDGSAVDVLNSQYFPATDELDSAEGIAHCSSYVSGRCGVKFNFFQPYGRYDVLDTDYETYTIVYSCTPILADAFNIEYLWILSRKPLAEGSI